MLKIVQIAVKLQKGHPAKLLVNAAVSREWGLLGDIHGGKGDRQVSLIENEARNQAVEKGIHGYCTHRFSANLSIEGISLQDLKQGTVLKAGNAALEITHVGKECFTDCPVHAAMGNCGLSYKIAFAKVVQDGVLQVGDEMGFSPRAE